MASPPLTAICKPRHSEVHNRNRNRVASHCECWMNELFKAECASECLAVNKHGKKLAQGNQSAAHKADISIL